MFLQGERKGGRGGKDERKRADDQALYYAAIFLFYLEKLDKAREYVDRLLKINNSSKEGLILKGWIEVYSLRESPNKNAVQYFESVLKTNNRNIYPIMASKLKRIFSGMFLGPKFSHNGKYNKNGKDVIPNIPLLDLKRKVIIFVDDPNSNYRETEFEEFINMSGLKNVLL